VPKPSGIEQFIQHRLLAGDCFPPKFIEGLPLEKTVIQTWWVSGKDRPFSDPRGWHKVFQNASLTT